MGDTVYLTHNLRDELKQKLKSQVTTMRPWGKRKTELITPEVPVERQEVLILQGIKNQTFSES